MGGFIKIAGDGFPVGSVQQQHVLHKALHQEGTRGSVYKIIAVEVNVNARKGVVRSAICRQMVDHVAAFIGRFIKIKGHAACHGHNLAGNGDHVLQRGLLLVAHHCKAIRIVVENAVGVKRRKTVECISKEYRHRQQHDGQIGDEVLPLQILRKSLLHLCMLL